MVNRVPITSADGLTGPGLVADYSEFINFLMQHANLPVTSVGGTGDTVTGVVSPSLTQLLAGMKFSIEWALNNTGPVTLDLDATGATPVVDPEGGDLVGGDLLAGRRQLIEYTGTHFRLLTPNFDVAGPVNDIQTFLVAGTWIKPAGLADNRIVLVRGWGGGAGGANSFTGTTDPGGGGGAYFEERFRAGDLPSSVAVVIGAGGLGKGAGSSGNGSSGSDTTFGTLLTARGGRGNGNKRFAFLHPSGTEVSIPEWDGANSSANAAFGGGGGARADGVRGRSAFGGDGGRERDDGSAGDDGEVPGGGGGAGTNAAGGDGAPGKLEVLVL